jgi:ribosome-associated protein
VSREPLHIVHGLAIPEEEIDFTFTRSGGPGGQNVNKVNTRVTLRFDVERSPSLSAEQKRRIHARLATRISSAGILQVVSRKSRSQAANRDAAEERFAELLREALAPKLVRKETATPVTARRDRLREKRHRSLIKRDRSPRTEEED